MPREDTSDNVPVTGAGDVQFTPQVGAHWTDIAKSAQEALDKLATLLSATGEGVTNGNFHDHYGGDGAPLNLSLCVGTGLLNIISGGTGADLTVSGGFPSRPCSIIRLNAATNALEASNYQIPLDLGDCVGTGLLGIAYGGTASNLYQDGQPGCILKMADASLCLQTSAAEVSDDGTMNLPYGQTYNINGVPHTHDVWAGEYRITMFADGLAVAIM